LGGWLYALTDGWVKALWVCTATVPPMTAGGPMMARPGRYPEDIFV
jgi:hypothetical protein